MTEREALKLALAEFENQKAGLNEVGVTDHNLDDLITAIKEALAQPEQEPDDMTIAYMAGLSRGKDLASQRQWVGLTEEETAELVHRYAFYELTRQIEAKLKEKNT